MTSNNLFTHPIEHILRTNAYGEIAIERYVTTFCEDVCRDWRPLIGGVFNIRPWESAPAYEARFEWLVESEDASRSCEGHLVLHETLQGMLRSFNFTAGADDRSQDGSLSLTILPWDEKEGRLTSSRVVRARVFDYSLGNGTSPSFYVNDGYGANALSVRLRQWKLTGDR